VFCPLENTLYLKVNFRHRLEWVPATKRLEAALADPPNPSRTNWRSLAGAASLKKLTHASSRKAPHLEPVSCRKKAVYAIPCSRFNASQEIFFFVKFWGGYCTPLAVIAQDRAFLPT